MRKVIVMCSLIFLTLEALANDNTFTLQEIIERALLVSPNLEVLKKELDISESQVKKPDPKNSPNLKERL